MIKMSFFPNLIILIAFYFQTYSRILWPILYYFVEINRGKNSTLGIYYFLSCVKLLYKSFYYNEKKNLLKWVYPIFAKLT